LLVVKSINTSAHIRGIITSLPKGACGQSFEDRHCALDLVTLAPDILISSKEKGIDNALTKALPIPLKFTLLKLSLLKGETNLSSGKRIFHTFIPFGGLTVSFQPLPIFQQVIHYHSNFEESCFLTITSLTSPIDTL